MNTQRLGLVGIGLILSACVGDSGTGGSGSECVFTEGVGLICPNGIGGPGGLGQGPGTQLDGSWNTACLFLGIGVWERAFLSISVSSATLIQIFRSYTDSACTTPDGVYSTSIYMLSNFTTANSTDPSLTNWDWTIAQQTVCSGGSCFPSTTNIGKKHLGVYIVSGSMLSFTLSTATLNPPESVRPTTAGTANYFR